MGEKPRDCAGCKHEYEEESDECPDCFDVTKDGFDAIREHYTTPHSEVEKP